MQKILFYDIVWPKNLNLPTKILAKDVPFSSYDKICCKRFDPNTDSSIFISKKLGVKIHPISFKWKRKDTGWYKYKFKKEEVVYCPFLKSNVTIKNNNYFPIWIGEIDHSLATDFWEENWSSSGLPKEEVINSGFPWNYSNIEEAKSDKFGVPHYIDKIDFNWNFTFDGKNYSVTKNGFITGDTSKIIAWDRKKPFVVKIK